jgi:hypothetical protein
LLYCKEHRLCVKMYSVNFEEKVVTVMRGETLFNGICTCGLYTGVHLRVEYFHQRFCVGFYFPLRGIRNMRGTPSPHGTHDCNGLSRYEDFHSPVGRWCIMGSSKYCRHRSLVCLKTSQHGLLMNPLCFVKTAEHRESSISGLLGGLNSGNEGCSRISWCGRCCCPS